MTAGLLQSLKPEGAGEMSHLPDYYNNLRELVTRLLCRPRRCRLRWPTPRLPQLSAPRRSGSHSRTPSATTSTRWRPNWLSTFAASWSPPGTWTLHFERRRAYLLAKPVNTANGSGSASANSDVVLAQASDGTPEKGSQAAGAEGVADAEGDPQESLDLGVPKA